MKNRIKLSTIITITLSLFFVFLLILGFYFNDKQSIESVRFVVKTDNVAEEISLFEREDAYYAFLPSYADFSNISIKCNAGYSILIDNESYKDSICKKLATDKKYSIQIKNQWNVTVVQEQLIIMKSENIPALSINLTNGSIEDINKDKNVEKTGNLTLIDSKSNVTYNNSFKSLHGRGNYTWEAIIKKPYTLEFENDINLIGKCMGKKYCLIPNAEDESTLRNKIIYDTAKRMGLNGTPNSEFVDLYINDVYYGLYLLTEKIEVSENVLNINTLQEKTEAVNQFSLKKYNAFSIDKGGLLTKGINIPNNPEDITGGYLVEAEWWYRIFEEDNVFATNSGDYYVIKYPRLCSQNQVEYISGVFQNIQDRISDDTYVEYIDLESWAKYYLIQEFFANVDKSSFYFYKDSDLVDSKVYAGPVWDFDVSIGYGGFLNGVDGKSDPYKFYVNSWGLYKELFKSEIFKESVSDIYENEFKGIINDLITNKLDEYENQINSSYLMNKCRWGHIIYTAWIKPTGSLENSVSYISSFLSERTICFDDVFLKNVEPVTVVAKSEQIVENETMFYVAKNHYIDVLPELSAEGYTFLGWYDQSGKKFNPNEKVTSDKYYEAKWEKVNEVSTEVPIALVTKFKNSLVIDSIYDVFVEVSFVLICFAVFIFVLIDIKRSLTRRKKR